MSALVSPEVEIDEFADADIARRVAGRVLSRFLTADMRQCKVMMSDETAAMDGMSIVTRGIDLRRYMKNRTVLLQHDENHRIGRMVDLRIDGTRLLGTVFFPPEIPAADAALAEVRAGLLNGVSIGFGVLESQPLPNGVVKVVRSVLYECSLVALPMLEDALVYERSANRADEATRRIAAQDRKDQFLRRDAALERREQLRRRELAQARREAFR